MSPAGRGSGTADADMSRFMPSAVKNGGGVCEADLLPRSVSSPTGNGGGGDEIDLPRIGWKDGKFSTYLGLKDGGAWSDLASSRSSYSLVRWS